MRRDSLDERTCEGELHRRNLTPPDSIFKARRNQERQLSDTLCGCQERLANQSQAESRDRPVMHR
jgi:hypothetical protein